MGLEEPIGLHAQWFAGINYFLNSLCFSLLKFILFFLFSIIISVDKLYCSYHKEELKKQLLKYHLGVCFFQGFFLFFTLVECALNLPKKIVIALAGGGKVDLIISSYPGMI